MKETGIERLQKLHKKPLDKLSLYVIYCLVFFTLYSIVELVVSSITGITHDALTEAVKFFCGGEAFLCCLIKLFKIRKTT